MSDSSEVEAPIPVGSQASPDHGASRALRSMIVELRAEATPELNWPEVERKLMLDVVKSDAARAAQRAAAPRSAFMQAFAFAAAAALIALGVSTANNDAPAASAPHVEPVAVDLAQIHAAPGAPGESGARDLAQLDVGDVVVTSDTPLTFRREGVVAFTLAPSSRITVRSVGNSSGVGTTVELEQGAIRAEVVPRAASEGLVEAFAVEVARTRVAVHGTAFTVGRTDTGIIVDVEHGTVAVGPTGNVGVTTGHILVGPSRATFSLDGGVTSRFLPREPAPAAPAIVAAAPVAAAAPLGALTIADPQDAAPSVLGVHPALAPHLAVAAVEAPAAPAPIDAPVAPPAAPAAPVALNEVVISARLHECFERASLGVADQTNAVSVVSTLHLTLQADGSVRSARFDPPLKPELMACAGGAIAGKFVDGNRQIDLPVSFHAR
ncbi:MAG: FecR domain-containing protein [Byssovorax sp.]